MLNNFVLFFLLSISSPSSGADWSLESWKARDEGTLGLIAECRTLHKTGKGESSPTPLIYFHGFSACPVDIDPLPDDLAQKLRIDLLKPRLSGHGIAGPDGLQKVSFEDWQRDAQNSLLSFPETGKFILMGTSTGATLALDQALRTPDKILALVLISPNLGLPRWDSELMLLPWGIGKWLTRMIVGEYRTWKAISPEQEKFWSTRYPSSALVEMMRTVDSVRQAPLNSLKMPILVFYCPDDPVVSSKAIENFFSKLPAQNKQLIQAPCNEDKHVLAGKYLSPGSTDFVFKKTIELLNPLL